MGLLTNNKENTESRIFDTWDSSASYDFDVDALMSLNEASKFITNGNTLISCIF